MEKAFYLIMPLFKIFVVKVDMQGEYFIITSNPSKLMRFIGIGDLECSLR